MKIKNRTGDKTINEYYHIPDNVCRCYTEGSTKRFVEWFDPILEVPEVALCDEVLINNEPDYAHAKDKINNLKVGESCIVDESGCVIVTRVK